MLRHHTLSRGLEHSSQDQGGDHGIVQGPEDRDELGDQIDGRRDPRGSEKQESLRAPGNARVTDQSLEQRGQVGEESGDLPGRSALSSEREPRDGQDVNG